MLSNFLEKNRQLLYFIGRIVAVIIIGPLLIYKGINYNDKLILLIGILLIIWDGIKVVVQILDLVNGKVKLY